MMVQKGKVKAYTLRVLALLAVVLVVFSLAACNGGKDGKKQGKKKVSFWAAVNDSNQVLLNEAIKNFNDTRSDIVITLVPQFSGYSSSLAGTLRGSNPPDLVMIDDKYFKSYVKEGYLTKLDDLIKSNTDTNFSLDDMWQSLVDRFSYNPESGMSGTGGDYYAIPGGNNPSVMYYNASLFKAQKVNIISVEESQIEKYNSDNNTSFLARGFHVYDTPPASGLSPRDDGKYYVFNNLIPANWVEIVKLSEIFTQSYNSGSASTYGLLNEWWFSHGWSIGGDCLEWDDELNQYIFNLGDETPNYIVTGADGVSINGKTYKEGDLLSFSDKKYVATNSANSDISAMLSSQKLYKLPAIRDAFAEFCRLSQAKSKVVTQGKPGYAVSPSPTSLGNNSKVSYFTTGEVAIVVDELSTMHTIGEAMKTLGKEWDTAPLYQYREYGDDNKLKVVNGTKIVGKESAHNFSEGYAIPANAKNKEAAWEFLKYMAGTEGQKVMMKANITVPNQMSLANSDDYLKLTSDFAAKNKRAIVNMAAIGTMGDWSYVEDGEWIGTWANILNTKVRDGNMTLEQFFAEPAVVNTNELLKKYTSKKNSR